MDILLQPISSRVDLSMQWVDTTQAKTFGDVLRILLDKRKNKPESSDSDTQADRQWVSINLPLRSLIVQQVALSGEEINQIRIESIDALTAYKIAQAIRKNQDVPTPLTLSDEEIREWMELRTIKALQRKVAEVTHALIWEIPLIGFHMEEDVAKILESLLAHRETESAWSSWDREEAYAQAA